MHWTIDAAARPHAVQADLLEDEDMKAEYLAKTARPICLNDIAAKLGAGAYADPEETALERARAEAAAAAAGRPPPARPPAIYTQRSYALFEADVDLIVANAEAFYEDNDPDDIKGAARELADVFRRKLADRREQAALDALAHC
jgi:hypothetical protein